MLVGALSVAINGGRARAAERLLVFAAVSLSEVIADVCEEFWKRTGGRVAPSFAASSVLARQIEAGAQADLFVSADEEWMTYLSTRRLIVSESKRTIARNALVLIAPKSAASNVDLAPAALSRALGAGRLALGDPASVPAGRYAEAALRSLGLWETVEKRLAPAENVRVALTYVSRGEVPLGIVYATDALADPRVRVVARFPDGTHPPIVYPAALTTRARSGAFALLRFMLGAEGKQLFARRGFLAP